MGRPPSNGFPTFRFNHAEVTEMEAILQAHNVQVPTREVIDALAEKFSTSAERSGKVVVQMKQIWNWFQNRRYAIRAKQGKPPVKLTVSTPQNQNNSVAMKNVPRAPQLVPCSTDAMRSSNQNTQITPAPAGTILKVKDAVRNVSDSQMEFEARSARDGAWYDVTCFLSHRSLETGDPEALVRFAGFGPEEDEWVNVRKHIRQRSLPCESSECIVVLPGDLILCFQEGKEQALYYDAHILDSQRRRHDIRGCRCRFLVRYDHDKSEEIVPLRKICRRPETDHRLQQLDAETGKVNQQRTGVDSHSNNTSKVSPTKTAQKDDNQTADSSTNGTVPLEASQQPISGSHNSGHIPNGNQNSKLTQPAPIAETGSNSILTQVRPATESHAVVEAKLHQISESTQPPVEETGSDTKATHMLPSPNSLAADAAKVNQTSEFTQLPPLAETVSDAEATRMLPSPNGHAADVAKVNQTSEITQLPPPAETNSNTVATQVLLAPENHAAVVAVSAPIQNSLPLQSQSK